MEQIKDAVAVVTGAGSGIGRAITLALGAKGAHLALADVDRKRLEQVEAEARQYGVDVITQVTDVAEREQVNTLADATYAHFERCNVLCNNAGVMGSLGTPVRDLGLEAWDWVLDVNLKGVIYGVHAFVNRMLDAGEPGHIVNTASMAGLISGAGGGAYCASKHAVVSISRSLRAELEGTNLGVSVLCPNFVATALADTTPALAGLREATSHDERAAGVDPETMKRLGQSIDAGMKPETVADMVVDSIARNRFYIITHPGSMDTIRAQFEAIAADEQDLRTHFPA